MTITTRLTSIRSREEAADARRTATIIAIICGAAALAIVGMLWGMMQ